MFTISRNEVPGTGVYKAKLGTVAVRYVTTGAATSPLFKFVKCKTMYRQTLTMRSSAQAFRQAPTTQYLGLCHGRRLSM